MPEENPVEVPKEPEAPAAPEGPKEPAEKTMSVEEYKSALGERDEKIGALEEGHEELGGKIETLQDSLDTALEELALKGNAPAAEVPESPDPVKKEEPKVEEGEVKTEEPKADEDKEKIRVDKEIEEAIREDRDFRDSILLREEVRDLKDEVTDVLETYPEAKEDEIYLGIEDGEEEENPHQVEILAKASHEKHILEKQGIKSSLEDELKGKIKKESEGDISVPQSPGSPAAPSKTENPSEEPSPGMSEDNDWSDALGKAKADQEEGA